MFPPYWKQGVIMAFKLQYLNQEKNFDEKVSLKSLLSNDHQYLCAKVNHRIRDLNYEVYFDAKIEFLTVSERQAILAGIAKGEIEVPVQVVTRDGIVEVNQNPSH
jgi:hypothetical protein